MNDSENIKLTKNDEAWKRIFDKYNILEQLKTNGHFIIKSEQINEFRETRLMVKFDHKTTLPKIFKDNRLSILPISRCEYFIGHFDTHYKVDYDEERSETRVEFPSFIQTIDYTNISSESLALHCAFNAGIIAALLSDLLEITEPLCYHTLFGRMSTGRFSFKIENVLSNNLYNLSVDSSQCEIDGGFETEDCLLIIEAKNRIVDDFLVRQLYYPYRLWKDKISKKVIPALMTYSDNLFSFFIYDFSNQEEYNSIKLVEEYHYSFSPEEIDTQEVSDIFNKVIIKEESVDGVPFPQANVFPRIIELLSLLWKQESLSKEEISSYYGFAIRQADYYSNAGKYLGLIIENESSSSTLLELTDEGLSIFRRSYKEKILFLIEKILEHRIFYEVFNISLISGEIPTKEEIIEIMKEHFNLDHLSDKTIKRRSTTVKKWIE